MITEDQKMKHKVLVTGGAGFIGSFLVEELVNKGFDVVVIDNLHRGREKNLEAVSKKIKFVNGDICDETLLRRLIDPIDIVYHLAAVSRVIPSIENPKLCFKYNIGGTEIVSRLCAKSNKKLIFASSREVYGDAQYLPVDENHPLNPKNPYASSKISGESIIRAYGDCYGLDYMILRLANVYGYRDFERVIPIFLDKCKNNEPMTIFGGKQILDLVHIYDAVNAFIMAMGQSKKIINIGLGAGISIFDLANITKNLTESESEVIFDKHRIGEVDTFISKIDYAKKIMGWVPKIELKQGLRLLLDETR